MIHSILIPLDGSKAARRALDYATTLGASQLRLLRVQPPPYLVGYPLEPAVTADILQAEQQQCQDYLELEQQRLSQTGLQVSYACRSGDPASQILEEAAESKVDLICIASHGRSGLSRFFLGSVAERVARHAPCPVLLVRVPQEES